MLRGKTVNPGAVLGLPEFHFLAVAICLKAGLYALRENPQARSVTMEHFLRAVKEEIPSVTEEMIQEYERRPR
jgi:SpoVK/Ycf46/Vps4 family AAA+-type ATPase